MKRARSLRAFGFLAQARAKQADGVAPKIDPAFVGSDVDQDEPKIMDAPPAQAPAAEPAVAAAAPATPDEAPAAVAVAEPALPSRWLLIASPLVAAVALVGLFWLILKGGGV